MTFTVHRLLFLMFGSVDPESPVFTGFGESRPRRPLPLPVARTGSNSLTLPIPRRTPALPKSNRHAYRKAIAKRGSELAQSGADSGPKFICPQPVPFRFAATVGGARNGVKSGPVCPSHKPAILSRLKLRQTDLDPARNPPKGTATPIPAHLPCPLA